MAPNLAPTTRRKRPLSRRSRGSSLPQINAGLIRTESPVLSVRELGGRHDGRPLALPLQKVAASRNDRVRVLLTSQKITKSSSGSRVRGGSASAARAVAETTGTMPTQSRWAYSGAWWTKTSSPSSSPGGRGELTGRGDFRPRGAMCSASLLYSRPKEDHACRVC